jgi:hypothetical protein
VFLALAVDERLVFLAVVGRVVSDVLDAQAHQAELALGFFVQVGAADSGDTAAHLNHSELVVVIADLIADASDFSGSGSGSAPLTSLPPRAVAKEARCSSVTNKSQFGPTITTVAKMTPGLD